MLTLKSVLPNFIKSAAFLAAITLSFAVFANESEEATEAAAEVVTEAAEAVEVSATEMKAEGQEVIGDLKEMTHEAEEAVIDETDNDMVAK